MKALAALLGLWLALCGGACAQSGNAKTVPQLAQETFSLFPDNTSMLIQPFALRQYNLDLLASIGSFALAPIANRTVLGNVSGIAAPPLALTAMQLTTLCNVFTSGLSGCVPASGGGTTNFLRADGAWTSAGGGVVSGAGTSGCAMGALVYTDGSTGNVRCDTSASVTIGFFGLQMGLGSITSVFAEFGSVTAQALASNGSTPDFTAGTCAVTGVLGSTLTGEFTSSGGCAGGTIILTGVSSQTNGFSCWVNNQTSAARPIRQTARTTTTATFTATINGGDVINYGCIGY